MEVNKNSFLNTYKLDSKPKELKIFDLKNFELDSDPITFKENNQKDIFKLDSKLANPKLNSYKFVEPEKPNEDSVIKANYNKDSKTATVTSDTANLSTKTVYSENSKILSSEILSKDKDSTLKFATDFNPDQLKFKKFGIESKDASKEMKATFDPQVKNLKGEINTNFGSNIIKINSEHSFAGKASKMGAEYLNNDFKITSEYDLKGNGAKLGTEYKFNDFKVATNFDYLNKNNNIGVNLQYDDIEVKANLNGKDGYSLGNIEASKSFKIAEMLPTAKFSIDYDHQKNTIQKAGIDLDAKITKDVSVTFSSNLAASAKQNAVKINYDVYTNTKVSFEANTNGVDRDKSGYKISFSSNFKF